MTTFYKQNDDGEYVKANDDVEELFRERSQRIIRAKLNDSREKYIAELRTEVEDEIRKNALETIKGENKQELETEYKEKLEALEVKNKTLDTALRRKTIAAEYGFKPDAEQFLGDGDDESMRAKADTLKNSFAVSGSAQIEKSSEPSVSKLQQKTGITVEI